MASRLRHWLIGGLFALVAPLAPAKAASNPTDTLREAVWTEGDHLP